MGLQNGGHATVGLHEMMIELYYLTATDGRLVSNAFMSVMWCSELAHGSSLTLDVRLQPASVSPYSHATRLEEHFYPNSLQYSELISFIFFT